MARTIDMSGVKGGGFDPIPRGTYHVALTDYEFRETSEEAKHPGEEYISFEFTVQSGEFEGRKLWTNAMLPPYDPWMLKNLMSACGVDVSGEIDLDNFLERVSEGEFDEIAAKVKVTKATEQYEAKNEIGGFKPLSEAKLSGGEPVSNGLMP